MKPYWEIVWKTDTVQPTVSVWSNMENSVLTDLRTVQNKSMSDFESNQENI